MKLITKKMAVLVLQAFTVAGILVGLAGVICLFDEMTDIYMLRGVLYTMQPDEQLSVLQGETNELIEDTLEYGIVAGFALAASFLTGLASMILTCFIKTPHSRHEG